MGGGWARPGLIRKLGGPRVCCATEGRGALVPAAPAGIGSSATRRMVPSYLVRLRLRARVRLRLRRRLRLRLRLRTRARVRFRVSAIVPGGGATGRLGVLEPRVWPGEG